MTGRFALFLINEYEAQGGLDDLSFIGGIDDCVQRAEQSGHFQLAQVVDLEAMEVVMRGEWWHTPMDKVTGLTADRGKIIWDYRWEPKAWPTPTTP